MRYQYYSKIWRCHQVGQRSFRFGCGSGRCARRSVDFFHSQCWFDRWSFRIDLPKVGDVNISDGHLDVYLVAKEVQPLRAVSHHIFHHGDSQAGVYHWRAKEVTLRAEPHQKVWIDGEIGGQTPFTVTTIPKSLNIVVPKKMRHAHERKSSIIRKKV